MKRYILLFSALISVIATTVISLIPLAGVSQGDISMRYTTLITPAGFIFSIWSLIYLAWIGLGLWYAFGKDNGGKKAFLFAGVPPLTVLWLFPWHYNFIGLSLVIMLFILGYLLYVFYRKNTYKDVFFRSTLHLTLGWILVATLANIHIFLVANDIYIYPVFFSIISLLGGLCYVGSLVFQKNTLIPIGVFIWALFGIIIESPSSIISLTAGISFGVGICLFGLSSLGLLRKK